jgi:hypothetical protein
MMLTLQQSQYRVVTPEPEAPAFAREAKVARKARLAAREDILNNLLRVGREERTEMV